MQIGMNIFQRYFCKTAFRCISFCESCCIRKFATVVGSDKTIGFLGNNFVGTSSVTRGKALWDLTSSDGYFGTQRDKKLGLGFYHGPCDLEANSHNKGGSQFRTNLAKKWRFCCSFVRCHFDVPSPYKIARQPKNQINIIKVYQQK